MAHTHAPRTNQDSHHINTTQRTAHLYFESNWWKLNKGSAGMQTLFKRENYCVSLSLSLAQPLSWPLHSSFCFLIWFFLLLSSVLVTPLAFHFMFIHFYAEYGIYSFSLSPYVCVFVFTSHYQANNMVNIFISWLQTCFPFCITALSCSYRFGVSVLLHINCLDLKCNSFVGSCNDLGTSFMFLYLVLR